jgi:uracil-DNA glycosylase
MSAKSDREKPATALRKRVAACTVCAASLPAGPRPIVQFSASATVLVIGQAPGAKVHASGVPWQDDSGDRLRAWMGIGADDFYDPSKIALVPMGFCYPGSRKGGDLPPRRECAPLWHPPIFDILPPTRLTVLVGTYALAHYAPQSPRQSLTDTVRSGGGLGPCIIPLPHPAWRVTLWMKKNPWFAETVLTRLQAAVRQSLGTHVGASHSP